MSHQGHDSRRQSPSGAARAFDDDFASPAAKRGLGFVDSAGNWDSEANLRPARPSPRLVTLSERSDEGSGAASMSVSVSSQPSQSGRNSEDEGVDRDGDGDGERDDDGGSLRDFPLDELEPVNLDDVRAFRGGGRSAYSSYRSSPAATPRRGARRSRSRRAATRIDDDDRRRDEFEHARDAEDGPRTPRQRRRARADAGETFARERTTTNTATGAWRGTVADPIPPRRRRLCLAVPLEAMAGWARAREGSKVRAGTGREPARAGSRRRLAVDSSRHPHRLRWARRATSNSGFGDAGAG